MWYAGVAAPAQLLGVLLHIALQVRLILGEALVLGTGDVSEGLGETNLRL